MTMLWSWGMPAKRARGGAGALDLVRCAIGSSGDGVNSLFTLGGGASACGSGVSAKTSRRGTAWLCWGDRLGVGMAETGGLVGVLAAVGVVACDTTLGGDLSCTLGDAGEWFLACVVGGRGMRRHASNSSRRLDMASSWVMVVGSGVSLRAPAIVWRPWMILSSGDGAGMVRNACRNSTVSEITWLLVSLLTSLKHRYESIAGPM